ncbi:hypothetical protein Bca4012_094366 [Brassica carinata]
MSSNTTMLDICVMIAKIVKKEKKRSFSFYWTDRPIEIISSSVSDHDENLLSTSIENETAILSEPKKKKKQRTSKETRYSSLFDEPFLRCISMEEDNSKSDGDGNFFIAIHSYVLGPLSALAYALACTVPLLAGFFKLPIPASIYNSHVMVTALPSLVSLSYCISLFNFLCSVVMEEKKSIVRSFGVRSRLKSLNRRQGNDPN